MATELEDKSDESESSDGYEEAIATLHNIVNDLHAAGAEHRFGTTLRTFNLINSLIELIEEPTLENPKSHEQIPG